MTQQVRLITYAIILVAVLLLGWLGGPKHNYQPSGLLLPTGSSFPAIPLSDVSLSNNALVAGTNVGRINIETYAPDASQAAVKATEQYAMQLAAAHGANHVVVTTFARNPQEKTIIMYAKAIKN